MRDERLQWWKYTVPLHSHTNVVMLTLPGTMVIGGPGRPDVAIAEHGRFVLPATLGYVAHCEAAYTFLVHGDNPFDIVYADAKDDPPLSKTTPATAEQAIAQGDLHGFWATFTYDHEPHP